MVLVWLEFIISLSQANEKVTVFSQAFKKKEEYVAEVR